MQIIKSLLAIGVITSLSGCVVIAGTPAKADYHQNKEISLVANKLSGFDIDVGSGSLNISGVKNLKNIEVSADIYTAKDETDDYELSLREVNGKAKLYARTHNSYGNWRGQSPRIDLHIKVPEKLMLDIKDGSGSISVENIAAPVSIDDGSGSINVENVQADLDIRDGSGSINVTNVDGNVVIDDGSGSLYVSQVSGGADIEDGSGQLTVKEVTGHVKVDDGSGSITIDNVGDLTIVEAGSGSLSVKNINGKYTNKS